MVLALQALDLYIAIICFMREFWDLQETGVEADAEAIEQLQRLTNKRVLVRASLADLKGQPCPAACSRQLQMCCQTHPCRCVSA